ncbi:MAG: hypothetical protein VR65_18145 [Desulfobulbaceae bacterium BRH_c16a]|nr:MAG: hypothetical protein VR65_18145 [Desulfobulbaceae bacterium BRH_c16a]
MDTFFTIITWFGSLYLLLPLTTMICLVLIGSGRSGQAVLLSLSLFITVILVHAAKLIFRQPRPAELELLVTLPLSWSFPSAHSAQATAFFLSVTLIAMKVFSPLPSALIALFSLLFTGVVGFSRVYLQVHYISDVLAGMILAVPVVLAVQFFIPRLAWLQGK